MDETSPAVKLRASVVRMVVIAIIALTFLLYVVIAYLVVRGKSVPGELWQAAGAGFGYLTATLVNTKHDATVQDPAPVQVVNQADDPVPVDAAPEAEPEPPVEDDAQESEPVVKRRRAG